MGSAECTLLLLYNVICIKCKNIFCVDITAVEFVWLQMKIFSIVLNHSLALNAVRCCYVGMTWKIDHVIKRI